MSIRWRLSGELVCAAMFDEEPGDSYIDDRLHYQLSVQVRALLADVNHETNGLWHWVGNPDVFLRARPERAAKAKRSCLVEGCDRPAKSRGRCGKHYGYWWRTEGRYEIAEARVGRPLP